MSTLYQKPGATFFAELNGAASGLVGTIGVRLIRRSDKVVVLARTTAGIVETPAGSGSYEATLVAPLVAGDYRVFWDLGTVTPETTAADDLVVTSSISSTIEPGSSAAYATRAELDAYVLGGIAQIDASLTDAEVDQILAEASRQIDGFVGPAWSGVGEDLVFGDLGANLQGLSDKQLGCLRRATCAHAEYRIVQGPTFFQQDQYGATNGPDFSTTGKLDRFGPKAREELRWSGLAQAVGGRLRR